MRNTVRLQFCAGLSDNLPPMREHDNTAPRLRCVLDDGAGDQSFAAAGWTDQQVAPLASRDSGIEIGNGRRGPITTQIQQRFLDIARGAVDDPYGWLTYVRAERESGRAVET